MARERSFWKFESRVALWTIRSALIVVVGTQLALLIHDLGGCQGGLKGPQRCESIPNGIANYLAEFAFFGYFASTYLFLPLVFLALCFEVLARWHAARKRNRRVLPP